MEETRLSAAVTFYVPAAIIAIAIGLAWREWRLFRTPETDELDLFPYPVSRLVRRMVGLMVLVALALTLAALGRWPPQTVTAAAHYFVTLTVLLALLLMILLLDLWSLGRTRPAKARPPRTTRAE